MLSQETRGRPLGDCKWYQKRFHRNTRWQSLPKLLARIKRVLAHNDANTKSPDKNSMLAKRVVTHKYVPFPSTESWAVHHLMPTLQWWRMQGQRQCQCQLQFHAKNTCLGLSNRSADVWCCVQRRRHQNKYDVYAHTHTHTRPYRRSLTASQIAVFRNIFLFQPH